MIIFRYLTKEVYSTLLAATIVLLLIFITNQFIHYLGEAASGGIPAKSVIQLMTLQVPLLLGYMMPLGLFLAILLAYGRLYVDNEMTVLAACGVSKWQLLGMTLGLTSAVVIMVAFLTLWLEPKVAWYRDHIFAEAAIASPLETVFPGRFQSLDHGKWILYVGDVSRDRKKMQDVFAANIPAQPNQPWTIVSAQGGYQDTHKNGDKFIVLTHGSRYLGTPGQKDFQIVNYGEYGMRLQPGKLHMDAHSQTEYMPTTELIKAGNKNPQIAAELQWRLTMPVATLLLAFLAVPLSQVKSRTGRYAKLLPAILIYIVYADLIFVAQAAIQNGTIRPLPGIWMVHAGMLALAIVLMCIFVGWPRFHKKA